MATITYQKFVDAMIHDNAKSCVCRIEDRNKRTVASGLNLLEALRMSREFGQGHVVVRESDGVPLVVIEEGAL